MLSRVNTGATFDVSTQGTHHRHDAEAAGAGAASLKWLPGNTPAGRSGVPSNQEPEPAAILDVSVEGRDLALQSLQLRKYDPATSPFKLDEGFFSEEAKQQRRAENTELLLDGSRHPKGHLVDMEGTLNRLVQDVVNVKMDPTTANNFTFEISRLIQGTWDENGNQNGTIEERAINREKGLKLAEYVAETYIDTPDEKEAFLNEVKRFYDNAVLRDKGYAVIEGPNGTTIEKPTPQDFPALMSAYKEAAALFSNTVFASDEEGRNAVDDASLKIFFRDAPPGKYDEIADRYAAGEISSANAWSYIIRKRYADALQSGKPMSDGEKSSASFAENEQKVSDTIDRVKSSLDMDAIREDVQRIIKDILSTFMSYDDYVKSVQEWKAGGGDGRDVRSSLWPDSRSPCVNHKKKSGGVAAAFYWAVGFLTLGYGFSTEKEIVFCGALNRLLICIYD